MIDDDCDDFFTEDGASQVRLTSKGFDYLTTDEIEKLTNEELLTLRFIAGRERQELLAPTVQELKVLVEWYDQIALNSALLDLVLKGKCYIDFDEGEPVYRITAEGREHVEKKLGL